MTVQVRNPIGDLLGHVKIRDPQWITNGFLVFVRAKDVRYYGTGLLENEGHSRMPDWSFHTITLNVRKWARQPEIHKDGSYTPGRIDFVLEWDGPLSHLNDIRGFQWER